jgi:CheY-like chemotaxis protein
MHCPIRILIVDDDAIARGAVRSGLDKFDREHLVIEADSGEEGLAIMRAARIDAIFCDIHMPGISGPEALAHAYGMHEKRPFMVLMSSCPSAAVKAIGQKIGVYEFLAKPFRSADVLAALAAYERLRQTTRILLVDDSATARKLMSRILGRSQFVTEIAEAGSGGEAVRLAKDTMFDVIFCDFNMPEIDGIQTATLLLQHNPAAQIVLVSTEQQSAMVRSAQHAGAFAFLKKPFEAHDVDAVLHDAFALRRPNLARPTHAIFSNEEALRTRNGPVEPGLVAEAGRRQTAPTSTR